MDRPVSRHVSLFRRERRATDGLWGWLRLESDGEKKESDGPKKAPSQFFPTDLFPNQLNPPITVYFARASPLRDGGTFRRDSPVARLRLGDAATAGSLDGKSAIALRSRAVAAPQYADDGRSCGLAVTSECIGRALFTFRGRGGRQTRRTRGREGDFRVLFLPLNGPR